MRDQGFSPTIHKRGRGSRSSSLSLHHGMVLAQVCFRPCPPFDVSQHEDRDTGNHQMAVSSQLSRRPVLVVCHGSAVSWPIHLPEPTTNSLLSRLTTTLAQADGTDLEGDGSYHLHGMGWPAIDLAGSRLGMAVGPWTLFSILSMATGIIPYLINTTTPLTTDTEHSDECPRFA